MRGGEPPSPRSSHPAALAAAPASAGAQQACPGTVDVAYGFAVKANELRPRPRGREGSGCGQSASGSAPRRRCAVARFSCRTAGQDTVEGAVVTYGVICRRGVRTVTWTVSVD